MITKIISKAKALVTQLLNPPKTDSQKTAEVSNNSGAEIYGIKYAVSGINPQTRRKKKVTVVEIPAAPPEVLQKKSGLYPPYEITTLTDPPTEKQQQYAQEIGLVLPLDATKTSASILITRYTQGLPLVQPSAQSWAIRYLIDKNILVDKYAGADDVDLLYFNCITLQEQMAFFCMRVYCHISGKEYCILEEGSNTEQEMFYRFANVYENDPSFTASFKYYSAKDLPLTKHPAIKQLKAYNIAVDFLKSSGAI